MYVMFLKYHSEPCVQMHFFYTYTCHLQKSEVRRKEELCSDFYFNEVLNKQFLKAKPTTNNTNHTEVAVSLTECVFVVDWIPLKFCKACIWLL